MWKNFKSWRCKDIATHFYSSQTFKEYDRYISIIAVTGQNRSVIIIPQNQFNERWENLPVELKISLIKCQEHGRPLLEKEILK